VSETEDDRIFRDIGVREFGLLAFAVICLLIQTPAQETAKTQDVARKCTPKAFHQVSAHNEPPIRIRKGEKPNGFNPTVVFQILESGEVAHVQIKRSSGISDIDQYALKSIRLTRYNRRPGCGAIDSQATVTVDFY